MRADEKSCFFTWISTHLPNTYQTSTISQAVNKTMINILFFIIMLVDENVIFDQDLILSAVDGRLVNKTTGIWKYKKQL